jgi:hypothetical protein
MVTLHNKSVRDHKVSHKENDDDTRVQHKHESKQLTHLHKHLQALASVRHEQSVAHRDDHARTHCTRASSTLALQHATQTPHSIQSAETCARRRRVWRTARPRSTRA